MAGAWITVIGAAFTFAINYFFIPKYSYMGLCLGYLFLLWRYDGQSPSSGGKKIPHTLCLEKIGCLYRYCRSLFLYIKALHTFFINTYLSLGIATLLTGYLLMVCRDDREKRIATAASDWKYFK